MADLQLAATAESQLRAILDGQATAWNRGDSDAWGSRFTEDADFVNILGQAFYGRAAIIERHRRIFAGMFQGSRTSVTMRQFSQLAPGVALIDAVHDVRAFKSLPPGIVPTAEGVLKTLMKYVAVMRDEGWLISAAQNTAILPDPTAAPTCRRL